MKSWKQFIESKELKKLEKEEERLHKDLDDDEKGEKVFNKRMV
jgi:hypothetical protein